MAPGPGPDAVEEVIGRWAAVRPDLDVSGLAVFERLHRCFLLYRAAIGARFAEVGATEPGFDVMAALRRTAPGPELSAGGLARQTLVTTGGLSLRLRRLEAQGHVRRDRDPDDQRMVHVSLTDSGRELLDRTADAHFANMRRMLSGLSPAEQEALARLLGRLFATLRAAGSDQVP
ncbi:MULTISPECIES: MarR family winged helix-turn-helix transcriptional regulator [unclassified Blastococcus]